MLYVKRADHIIVAGKYPAWDGGNLNENLNRRRNTEKLLTSANIKHLKNCINTGTIPNINKSTSTTSNAICFSIVGKLLLSICR